MNIEYFTILKKDTESALKVYEKFIEFLNARKEFKDLGIEICNDMFTFAGRTFRFGLFYIQKENVFAIDMENTAFDPGKGIVFRFTFEKSLFELDNGTVAMKVHFSASNAFKEIGQISFEKLTAPDSDEKVTVDFIQSFFKWLEKSYSDKVLKLK